MVELAIIRSMAILVVAHLHILELDVNTKGVHYRRYNIVCKLVRLAFMLTVLKLAQIITLNKTFISFFNFTDSKILQFYLYSCDLDLKSITKTNQYLK
jgi:hypothetical protein